MPVFSLAPEASQSRRPIAQPHRPADPMAAINKFIKELDSYAKRYEEDFKYLDTEANAILDKLEETTAEDDENLERVERDLESIRLLRRKLGKLYTEPSHNEERPWVIGVRADAETRSWGNNWIFSDLESLVNQPLELESGETIGDEAAKEFRASMKKVEKEKNVARSGLRPGMIKGIGMGMAKMFGEDQMYPYTNTAAQEDQGTKGKGKNAGGSDDGSEGSSTTNPSEDSFARRLAEKNKADMKKRRDSPEGNIEVIRRNMFEGVSEESELEEPAPKPVKSRKKTKTPAQPAETSAPPAKTSARKSKASAPQTKTKPKRATADQKRALLNPQRETDNMVLGLFGYAPEPEGVKRKHKKRPAARNDLEETSPRLNISGNLNSPGRQEQRTPAMPQIPEAEMIPDLQREPSPQPTESSDGLFVTEREPYQWRRDSSALSPASLFRESPVRVAASPPLPPSTAVSRRSVAPEPEDLRPRDGEEGDGEPFFRNLPETIWVLPEQVIPDEEKAKKRGPADAALGLYGGAMPPKKKVKEGQEGVGTSGRVKWPGQKETVKKGGKRA